MKNALAAALLGAASAAVSAQETLPPSIVTATRTAETVDETLAAVTVITREEIQRLQARSLQELLAARPGIALVSNGGLGKQTSLFLRGTESDHVLVLVDGIKAGSATVGGAAWHDLPLDQIERIEIVRGPRSSLYGSEAIGGVVQIFTRKGGGKLRPSVSVGAGSHATRELTAALSGGGERGWFNVNASHIESDGFNSCQGHPFPPGGGCFTSEPDDDGYRRSAASVRAGYRFSERLELDFNLLHARGHNDYDGSFQNENDFIERVVGGRLIARPLAAWRLELTAGRSWDDAENFLDGAFASRFESIRDTLSLQNDLELGHNQLLTVGADYQRDEVDSDLTYDVNERDNLGLFALYQGEFGRHRLELAGRFNDNEQFGQETTGSLAWGYDLGGALRLTASYGTAFKAPTINELYYPGYGNPDLEPEESRTVEFGLRGKHRYGSWDVQLFQTDVDNLIAHDAATNRPANIDAARIRGLEATASARVAGWSAALGLTLLDTENRSGINKGKELPRRPRQSVRLDLDRAFGAFGLGATVAVAGKRYDDAANSVELGGYGLLDLRASYAFHRDWQLAVKLGNVFDKNYETARYYNQPGRELFVTLRYEPARE